MNMNVNAWAGGLSLTIYIPEFVYNTPTEYLSESHCDLDWIVDESPLRPTTTDEWIRLAETLMSNVDDTETLIIADATITLAWVASLKNMADDIWSAWEQG